MYIDDNCDQNYKYHLYFLNKQRKYISIKNFNNKIIDYCT